jgi:hypothetical protein
LALDQSLGTEVLAIVLSIADDGHRRPARDYFMQNMM